jgi:hypothetical protein
MDFSNPTFEQMSRHWFDLFISGFIHFICFLPFLFLSFSSFSFILSLLFSFFLSFLFHTHFCLYFSFS